MSEPQAQSHPVSNGAQSTSQPVVRSIEPPVVKRQSQTQGKLVLALSKAKQKFTAVPKTKTAKVQRRDGGVGYEYKYADLGDIVAMSDPPLLENELVTFHDPNVELKKEGWFVTVTTELRHSSDEWRSVDVMLPCLQPTAQGIGSIITYARRYGLNALLGIVTDEDDDALAGGGAEEAPRPNGGNARTNEAKQMVLAGKGKPVQQRPDTLLESPRSAGKSVRNLDSGDLLTLREKMADWLKANAKATKSDTFQKATRDLAKVKAELVRREDEEMKAAGEPPADA